MTRRRDVLGATTEAAAGAALGVRPVARISDGEAGKENRARLFFGRD